MLLRAPVPEPGGREGAGGGPGPLSPRSPSVHYRPGSGQHRDHRADSISATQAPANATASEKGARTLSNATQTDGGRAMTEAFASHAPRRRERPGSPLPLGRRSSERAGGEVSPITAQPPQAQRKSVSYSENATSGVYIPFLSLITHAQKDAPEGSQSSVKILQAFPEQITDTDPRPSLCIRINMGSPASPVATGTS